jgi:multiple sugar transport system substrate-binding protein
MQALTVQIIGGVAPDLYMVRSENMPSFVSQGFVSDLSAYYKRDIRLNDFLPAWGSMFFNGRYYGVPVEGGGYREDAMFVNRDIFEQAGMQPPGPEIKDALRFDKWTELARRLTIDRNNDGTPEQWGTHFRTSRWYFFLPSNGVNVFTDDFTDTQIDKPASIEVLDYLQKLQVGYKVSAPDSYWFENKGNVAMNIYWRARLAVTPDTIGNKFDYSVAPMPAGRAGSVGLTKMNPITMNPKAQHKEEAWRFLRYLLSEPAQRVQASEGRATLLRSVALDPKLVYTDKPPYNLMPFLGGAAVDATMQFEPAGITRPKAVNDALSELWKGNIPASTAATQMAQAWRSVLLKK